MRVLFKVKERDVDCAFRLINKKVIEKVKLKCRTGLATTELLMKFAFFRILDVVLLVFFQVLALWLLTYNISVIKELKIENSLIIALLLHWGSFTIVLFILI